MSVETEIGSVRKFVQDLISPELGALKANIAALQREIEIRADAAKSQLDQALKTLESQRADSTRHTEDLLTINFERLNNRITGLYDLHGTVMKGFDVVDAQLENADLKHDAAQNQTEARIADLRAQNDLQFRALLASIGETRAQAELSTLRVVSELAERIAVIELRFQTRN